MAGVWGCVPPSENIENGLGLWLGVENGKGENGIGFLLGNVGVGGGGGTRGKL